MYFGFKIYCREWYFQCSQPISLYFFVYCIFPISFILYIYMIIILKIILLSKNKLTSKTSTITSSNTLIYILSLQVCKLSGLKSLFGALKYELKHNLNK